MRFTLPLIALVALAAPAIATEKTVDVRVSYADLDVTSDAGRATLEARLAAKLREACTIESPVRYVIGRTRRDERCIADGLANAKAEVERVAAAEQRLGREIAAN